MPCDKLSARRRRCGLICIKTAALPNAKDARVLKGDAQ